MYYVLNLVRIYHLLMKNMKHRNFNEYYNLYIVRKCIAHFLPPKIDSIYEYKVSCKKKSQVKLMVEWCFLMASFAPVDILAALFYFSINVRSGYRCKGLVVNISLQHSPDHESTIAINASHTSTLHLHYLPAVLVFFNHRSICLFHMMTSP